LNRQDASLGNAERWAKRIPTPVYAIDDQTAMKVLNDEIEVTASPIIFKSIKVFEFAISEAIKKALLFHLERLAIN